ncbi:MAG: transglutaminase-like superfamily [Clostridiales bacterium]|nr:transglutaminase-like superfamily [Clostridiales bacterium]
MSQWKRIRRIFALLAMVFCLVICMGLPLNASASSSSGSTSASIPKVTIKECSSVSYNTIMLCIEQPSTSYTIQVYRATSSTGTYKLVDSIKCSSWTTYNGITYTTGTKDKITCIKDSGDYYLYNTSLSFNKRYYYRIRLVNSSGTKGEFSKKAAATTKLEQVSLASCYAKSSTSVYLKWAQTDGAQGYYIYRKESGGSMKQIATVSGGSTLTYTDNSVQANKKYYYRVRAYRKSGSTVKTGKASDYLKVSTGTPTVSGSYSTGSVYGPSLSTSQLLEVRRVVQAFKDNYIKSSMSDYQKVLTAYNYIRYNCSYAWAGWQYNGANTAWGSLVYGEAQCSGFARGMKALCDGIGISCYYVHANSSSANSSHQWNEVCVDGKWYILDAQGGFFLVSANTYKSYTGMDWDTSGLPTCSSDHSMGGFTGSIM